MAAYTPRDRARILAQLPDRVAGGEPLDSIAATPGWPSRPTLRHWIAETPGLADRLVAARSVRRAREPYPFQPARAEALLVRIRLGEPLIRLLREPGLPRRRQLNRWKRTNPAFAAAFEDAARFADRERRFGPRRRTRLRWSEAVADRLMRAVQRGATMPQIYADRDLPNRVALRRWRRDNPAFAAALVAAQAVGARVRREGRTLCTPQLMAEIERRLVEGASLHSLSKAPDMPGLFALYKWVRVRPDFAAMVARACRFRDEWALFEDAAHARPREARAILKRLGQLNPHPGERRRQRDEQP